jgi:Double-GTPase 1
MSNRSVFVAGLPNAGKTTFLAALWHLVEAQELSTVLAYAGIAGIDVEHLRKIRNLWLEAKPIPRTRSSEEKLVQINLKADNGDVLQLQIPDFAGESFRRFWEHRGASETVVASARDAQGHLLLINIDRISYPRSVHELRRELVDEIETSPLAAFDPRKVPTAPMLADVLIALESEPINANPRRVAIGLTAWDTVASDGQSPEEVLEERLPLIAQMIKARASEREYRVYGISAQGGSYSEQKDRVLAHDNASDRLVVKYGEEETPDLTTMLSWLLGH